MQEPHPGWFEGREHRLPIRVYYEDTDFSGIVYHANYVRFFERGRSEFLRQAGVTHTDLRASENPIAFAVLRMEIDFQRAARVDDALVVRTRYKAVKGPRLFIEQTIERGGEPITQAVVHVACIDMEGRARRPPKDLLDRLKDWFFEVEA